jgi:serine/threonine-protein kinase
LELTAGASGYSAQTKLDFKGLSDATAIAVDSSGDVYVVDDGTAEILEVPKTASGFGEQETVPIKGFGAAATIAVASNGDVFAAFEGSDEVGTPAVLVLLPRSGDGYGTQEQLSVAGLNGPTGLVVTPAGVLVISESDVQLDASVVALGQV